jgi:hypothetical protein
MLHAVAAVVAAQSKIKKSKIENGKDEEPYGP